MLLLLRTDGTAVSCEGAGEGGCGANASSFSVERAMRLPPRTPPSQDKKHARTAPVIRSAPAKKVGRR